MDPERYREAGLATHSQTEISTVSCLFGCPNPAPGGEFRLLLASHPHVPRLVCPLLSLTASRSEVWIENHYVCIEHFKIRHSYVKKVNFSECLIYNKMD